MKLANMTAERRKKRCVAPPKIAWAAIAASVVLHAVGLAALAAWSTSTKSSHVRFAGHEQAFQLTLSLADPLWNVDPVSLDDFEPDPPVVIEPHKARIGKHTYVRAPTVELSADDLLLDSAIDSIEALPELATLDEVQEVEPPRANPKTSQPARAALPSSSESSLGNTEDIPPDLSRNAPPIYPAHAIQNGWEGTVLLRIWIDETGRVTKVEVARTSGFRILDGAAVTAVRRWLAIPANRDGKPAATVELLPVRFKH